MNTAEATWTAPELKKGEISAETAAGVGGLSDGIVFS